MRLLLCSSLLLFSALIICAASNTSQHLPSTQDYQPCIHDHFSALLDLKPGIAFSTRNDRLSSWNENNKDCCSWYGVFCDGSTGQVVSLLLDDAAILGEAYFSSILRLHSLQQLYLSAFTFVPVAFPSGLDQLPNLTNLALLSFYGQIPQDIANLRKLVFLHLSGPSSPAKNSMTLQLGRSTLRGLTQNLSSLEELQLSSMVISAQGQEWGEALSALPNLRKLNMSNSRLSGPIHPSLSRLHFLTELDLSYNNLSSPVPSFIADFSSLTLLSIVGCGLQGAFPPSIFNMPNLAHVEIDENPDLVVSFPEFTQNSSLKSLVLSNTRFYGRLPYSLGNLRELSYLYARYCKVSGPLPSSLVNLSSLKNLDLSYNNLSGPLPSSHTNELWKLRTVDLSYNQLGGTIPPLFFLLPVLIELNLEGNQFTGFAGEFQNASSSPLMYLYLKRNNLQGPIPSFIFQLKTLLMLDLSMNNFSGIVELSLFAQLNDLQMLDLSNNPYSSIQDGSSNNSASAPFPLFVELSLHSCYITKFPNVLKKVRLISRLDLSNNSIKGEIPQWIWTLGSGDFAYLNLSHNEFVGFAQPSPNLSFGSWQFIDLSFNKLQGSIMIPPQLTFLYSVANNFFSGEVPSLICNLTFLRVLDLSHNQFTGSIRPCLGDISNSLDVLNLQGNAFYGSLNMTFREGCSLKTLDVSGNYLEGQVPPSIVNCSSLELLNLGDNQLHDTFPAWLENLPQLRVLVLRSNRFYGGIGLDVNGHEISFSQLQIFDISSNGFVGGLPRNVFKSWKRMIGNNESLSTLSRLVALEKVYYQDTVTVMLKGTERTLEKILTAFTLIDISDNKFRGSIPKSVGDLGSLRSLNLSYNSFTDQIPATLGSLSVLETLDLSQNSLSGEIPSQLTKLNFLAVLNLSHNLLKGAIPQGQQFSAFSNDSFLSNSGLCGPPLSRKCTVEDNNTVLPMSREYQDKFDWSFVWSGFAVGNGVGVGLFIWTLALWSRGRIQFILFIDKVIRFIFPSGIFSPIHLRTPVGGRASQMQLIINLKWQQQPAGS
ncbi:hypothetical protein ACLOJK_035212 [Asimina triloba]